jgi:uncharacterized membrane protein YphA (DoxX/SURF4 family)
MNADVEPDTAKDSKTEPANEPPQEKPRAAEETPAPAPVSPLRAMGFRFLFLYLLLTLLPFPIGSLPGTEGLGKLYDGVWKAALPWIGNHVLHLSHEVSVEETGSGDTTAAYLQLGCTLLLAAVGTALWTAIRRRKPQDPPALAAGLRVYVRYYLAAILLSYGFAKIFKHQFPFPAPERLFIPFSAMSPMGLLWRFMGFSTAYSVFGGLAEAFGGALLFFRRTTTLGALIVAAVMLNVFMLNLAYDVPVKLFSFQLLLFAGLLLAPDLRRLASVFVLNRPVEAADLRPPPLVTRHRRAHLAGKAALILALLGNTLHEELDSSRTAVDPSLAPVIGMYDVESYESNGTLVPPLLTDPTRWRRVAITKWGFVGILMNDERRVFSMEYDAATGKLTLDDHRREKQDLSLKAADPDHLLLVGTLGEDKLSVRLKKIDTSTTPIATRGFHWVSEFPFNR